MRLKTDSLLIIGFTLIILCVVIVFQTNLGDNITAYALARRGTTAVCVGKTTNLVPIGNLIAYAYTVFTYDVDHTGSAEDEVTYSDDANFTNIDPAAGIINFWVDYSYIGNYTVVISVNNTYCFEEFGDREEINFEIADNNIPVLGQIENQTVWEDGFCDISPDYPDNCGIEPAGVSPVGCSDTCDPTCEGLFIHATDPDGDSITYACNDTTYFTVNETTGLIEWMPTNDDVGLYWFTCNATDEHGAFSDSQEEFFIYVNNTNDEPIFDNVIPNFTVKNGEELYEDTEFEYDVNATDPDGDTVTYNNNIQAPFVIIEATGEIIFTPQPAHVGNHTVRIYADDSKCVGLTDQITLFEILPVNDVPELDPMVSFKVTNESTLCVDANATDEEDGNDYSGENLNLTFTDDTDLFDINSTGGFCLTPNETQIGTYTVNISVTDTGIPSYGISNATNSSLIIIYVTAPELNLLPPVIYSSNPDLNYTSTGLAMPDCLTFSLTTEDPEGGNLTVYWYLDDTLANTTESSPGLATHSYEKCNWLCPSTHNLTAVVSDGLFETPLEWTITITMPCVPPGVVVVGGGGEAGGAYGCKETWVCTAWSTCMITDIQLRTCKDIRECGKTLNKPPEVRPCIFTLIPTCFDRIRNQDEILPDCGGVCKPCPTCSDGICNQGELCSVCDVDPRRCPRDLKGNIMMDCGGPCPLCPKVERVVQPKVTTWKTAVLTIIKISLIVLLIILIGLIITIKVIRYMSKKAVLTEKEKAELSLVNEINVLIKYAEKAIDLKDMEQLKIICANIEERYNRLSSTKNKKKMYPKLERLQKAIRIGF